MKSKRTFLIALISLLGVALTIGYAVLSQTLKINGSASIASNSWIIYFDHLVERPGTMETTTPATINATKDTINFGITLDKPGDNYTFEVDIINDGTIDAMVDSVSLSGIPESLNGIIEWKVNYLDGTEVQKCDELLANSKRRIKVVVNYNKDIDTLPDAQDLDLTFTVKYVQLDNSECSVTNPSSPDPIDPNDGRYTLTIDPNYGIYHGTDDVTIVRMSPGEVYVFAEDPVQEVHTFTGWTVDKEDTYTETNKMITMDKEDITATANYTWDIVDEENDLGYCFSVNGDNYYTTFEETYTSIVGDYTTTFQSDYQPILNTAVIKLLHNNCDTTLINSTNLFVPDDVDLTFDLNGHKTVSTLAVYNFGNLLFTDKSSSKKGEYSYFGSVGRAFYNNNVINLQYGTYNTPALIAGNSDTYATIDSIVVNSPGAANGNTNLIDDTISVTNSIINAITRVAIYGSEDMPKITIKNVDINMSNYGKIQAIWLANSAELENIKINIEDAGVQDGIYSSNSDVTFKDIDIRMKNVSVSGHGICNLDSHGDMSNINIDIEYVNGDRVTGIQTWSDNISNVSINIIDKGTTTNQGGYGIEARSSNVKFNNIDVNVDLGTISGYCGIYGLGNYDNTNVTIKARKGGGTIQGISASNSSTIKNSNIIVDAPIDYASGTTGILRGNNIENVNVLVNTTHYGYGIQSINSIKDSIVKVNATNTAYGIISANTSASNVTVEVKTDNIGFGITSSQDLTINDSTIKVDSTRTINSTTPPNSVIGVQTSNTIEINDSHIIVNGNSSTESNDNVNAINVTGETTNNNVNTTEIKSSSICFKMNESTATINLDNLSTLTCDLAETSGFGTLNKE